MNINQQLSAYFRVASVWLNISSGLLSIKVQLKRCHIDYFQDPNSKSKSSPVSPEQELGDRFPDVVCRHVHALLVEDETVVAEPQG